jgi:hypothetical protein
MTLRPRIDPLGHTSELRQIVAHDQAVRSRFVQDTLTDYSPAL